MPFEKSVRMLPEDDRSSGWNEILAPPAPPLRLRGNVRADCAVVGAGFTGLAIARRLAEVRPEWKVVVVDGQRIGSGASGRASGFVVDLTDFAAKMQPAARRRYIEVARGGIERLRRLVRELSIVCDWDETGWIRAAAGEKGLELLDDLPPQYDHLGIDYLHLDRGRMREITGSTFYAAGLRLPGYPLVSSAALVRGLADKALPQPIELYEETPVRAIAKDRTFRLRVNGGMVIADRLFLATNGYTPALGFLRNRVFPLYTFGSLTRPLSETEQKILGGESEWGILAMDPMGSTVRRTRDQRILIRNTSYYNRNLRVSEPTKRRTRQAHRRAFLTRFPELRDVEFEYTWAGLMGTARNGQVSFGELRENLFVAAGYTAAGIAMGTAAGCLLADLATGIDSQHLRYVQSLPKPTWMPPDPFRSAGGWWLNERMNASAGAYL